MPNRSHGINPEKRSRTETSDDFRSPPAALFRRAMLALLSISALFSAWWLSQSIVWPQTRYLIINADDAGMYHSVNVATIEAMEHGTISSVSIMVPCPGFPEFARYASAHPEKDFGVHLTLNCDTTRNRWGPVLPRTKVPSLVDQDGFLWSTTARTARHAKLAEVELELRAQIERAQQAGVQVSHLDHHMFVLYSRPDFLRLYVRLAIEYNLPIRYEASVPVEMLNSGLALDVATTYRDGLHKLRQFGLPVVDQVESNNYGAPARDKPAYFLNLLATLKPGVSELVIHCADNMAREPQPPDVDRRAADFQFFTSASAINALHREGIQAISWRQFRILH